MSKEIKTRIQLPSIAGLQKAFKIAAFASLKHKGIKISDDRIEAEAARIERMVTYKYRTDKENYLQYGQFASWYLQNHLEEIKNSTGMFVEDVPEVRNEKQFFLDDVTYA